MRGIRERAGGEESDLKIYKYYVIALGDFLMTAVCVCIVNLLCIISEYVCTFLFYINFDFSRVFALQTKFQWRTHPQHKIETKKNKSNLNKIFL